MAERVFDPMAPIDPLRGRLLPHYEVAIRGRDGWKVVEAVHDRGEAIDLARNWWRRPGATEVRVTQEFYNPGRNLWLGYRVFEIDGRGIERRRPVHGTELAERPRLVRRKRQRRGPVSVPPRILLAAVLAVGAMVIALAWWSRGGWPG